MGAFVLFAGMGNSSAGRLLHPGRDDAAGDHHQHARGAGQRADGSFREACWNMGATRWQTIRTIVLPNSISGILTGVILQVARAAGETAPIMFTGAVFFIAVPDTAGNRSFPTVCATVHGPVDAPVHAGHPGAGRLRPIQYGTAVVLIGLVLAGQRLGHRPAGVPAVAEEMVSEAAPL